MRWKKTDSKPRQSESSRTRWLLVAGSVALLMACSSPRKVYAPVTDVATIEAIPKKGVHYVRPGETLYAIAWRYGMDYRDLAAINHIAPPWRVWVGEPVRLKGHVSRQPTARPVHVAAATRSKAHLSDSVDIYASKPAKWLWPAKGHLAGSYSSFNRGINISGHIGDPVYATASGRVVYAGDGLRGYGNLIIIKHNNAWLSAYAWNSTIAVHQGETVRAGQRIATIGHIGRQRPMLHFEIRNNGKPVNPLQYLTRRTPV